MKTYETTSLQLASFLRAKNFPILNVKQDSSRVTFEFLDDSSLRNAVSDFYNNCPIENQTFWHAIKSTKDLVYQTLKKVSA